jgi:AraC-like DNA-binding protein
MSPFIPFFILFIIYSSFSVVLVFIILALDRKNLAYLFLYFLLQAFHVLSPAAALLNTHIEPLRLVVASIKVIVTPLIFFHIKRLTQTEGKITLKESLHFIPAIVVFIVTLILYFGYPGWRLLNITEFYKTQIEGNFHFNVLANITRPIVFFQGIFYALMIYKLFKRNDSTLRQIASDISQKNMIWMRYTAIFVGIRGLITGGEWFGIYSIPAVFGLYYIFVICFSFYIFFHSIIQPDISIIGTTIQEMADIEENEPLKESKFDLNVLKMFKMKELFLKPDLTLQEAADELSIPKYRLTQLIKDAGYHNFYAFVNEHRVDFSKELLIHLPDNFALESVIADSGFQSKSTFYRVFKESTGLTPKEYKDMKSLC